MSSENKKELGFVQVKLEYKYPEDLQTHFVTNVVIQHQPDFFALSFFEVIPPAVLVKTPEEKRSVLEALDHIDAKCVARIVVSPEKMVEFAKAMNDNLSNYQTMQKLRPKQN